VQAEERKRNKKKKRREEKKRKGKKIVSLADQSTILVLGEVLDTLQHPKMGLVGGQ